ncbi:MAG: M56 family metallopeptidase [Chitinophagaceae bacterium]
MSILSHSPFLKALGWCLLNSLWQFCIIWLLFLAIIHIKRNFSPAIKHGLALVLLSIGFIWFAGSLSIRYFSYSEAGNQDKLFYQLPDNTSYSFIYRFAQSFLENNLSYFSIFYLLIVAGFFVRFFGFFFYAQNLKTRGLNKMRAEWRLYVLQLVQQLNIRHKVQVWISEHVDTPMVMGVLKPTILIPVACINQLSVKQLEAILLHELAHIKRNDYLTHLYIGIAEILFFFNPFARLFIKSIKLEREKSCDDWVLQFRFDPYQYASALFTLEQSRSAAYSLAIAATGESKNLLLQRIQRIMGIMKVNRGSRFKLVAYFLTIGLLSFIALVNPGEIVVKNIDNTFSALNARIPEYSPSLNRTVNNSTVMPAASKPVKTKERNRKKWITSSSTIVENNNPKENSFDLPVSMDVKEDEYPGVTLLQSVVTGKKEFSIKEIDPPAAPEIAVNNEFPFVPNSSFTYFTTEDSSLAKLKTELYFNQAVRRSLVKAQNEIQNIELNKIAKLHDSSKSAFLQLQRKIHESVQQLNVQQLYNRILDSSNNINLDNLKASAKEESEYINYYKVLQLQFKSIKTELQKQHEKNKKDVDSELKEIQKQIKKIKVIVYI